MGNIINSIVFFQLTDEYKAAENNLDNYFLMKENINEEEVNDLILSVNNNIEYDKLKKRMEKLIEQKNKNECQSINDDDDNDDNDNNDVTINIKKSKEKPKIILQ